MTRVLKNGRWKYCSRSYGICFTSAENGKRPCGRPGCTSYRR